MRLLIIFCLVLVPALSYSKGMMGRYYITGIAYDENKNPLADAWIQLEFKGQKTLVHTDREGRYKLTVVWSTTCQLSMTDSRYGEMIRQLNPKWIKLTWDSRTVKIKNTWRRYSWKSDKEEKHLTKNKDLKFA